MFSRVVPSLGRSVLLVAGVALVAAMVLAGADRAHAAGAPGDTDFLGAAGGFAVLGASVVTNTGPSVITGDLGVTPGTTMTGFPPGIVLGTIHQNDTAAVAAQIELLTAYNTVVGLPSGVDLSGQDLGGLTLLPGTYDFNSSAQLTGATTLDAQGDPDAVFVIRTGSLFTTASGSSVQLINGAQPCNVFWQFGSSATLGSATTFVGTVLALTSIYTNASTQVDGRLLAVSGAMTLDTTRVTRPTCASTPDPSTTALTASPNPVTVGAETVLTATVTGDAPTGTVEFFSGTSSLGTAPVTGGTATLTTSSLTLGDHSFTAVYSGDSDNASSTSGAITVTVEAAAAPAALPATGFEAGLLGLGGVLLLASGALAVTARRRSNA